MSTYKLMHKNDICGLVEIDDKTQALTDFEKLNDRVPFCGNADLKKMSIWWDNRAIPASRETLHEILEKTGCKTSKEYLAKNLALSLSDTYWICPEKEDLSWNKVKMGQWKELKNGYIPYHNDSSFDPNSSLGGKLNKYWDLNQKIPVLIKRCPDYYGQQAINEAIASVVHDVQKTGVPFVAYHARKGTFSVWESACTAFTDEDKELVSAYEVIESEKQDNERSLYDTYIDICVAHGIDRQVMQDFMDYQTISDFVLSNTDRHLNNFGVLRDTDSMQFIAPAPIFDTGNSMFYNISSLSPMSRLRLIEQPIVSFHKTQDKMLSHVKNKSIFHTELLPAADILKETYCKCGIPEDRAEMIAKNYQTKIEMLKDFQRDIQISIYAEKQKTKDRPVSVHKNQNESETFDAIYKEVTEEKIHDKGDEGPELE